jgi:DNA-binding transcriptional ArsR family regulator
MTDPTDMGDPTLTPDDAFALLGNETRMAILRSLGDADDPVPFSDLRQDVGMRDSGQFNYHLDKLVGQFVEQTEEGYVLRQVGQRVIEAILSGAVTHAPEFELTTIDETCHYCGSQVAVRYGEERVRIYCTNCEGAYDATDPSHGAQYPDVSGYLGTMMLPPAGVAGRTPADVYHAAWTWANLEILAMASGVCPRCSADIEWATHVCAEHDKADGICNDCGRRHAVFVSADCTNCNYGIGGGIFLPFATMTPLLSFLLEHGINPIAPGAEHRHELNRIHEDYTEDVVEIDPLRVRFTTTIDGDEFSITTDEELDLLEATY